MGGNNYELDEYRTFVPIKDIKEYISLGTPVVPLGKDGLPLVLDLYTPSELDSIKSRISESESEDIFRDPFKKIGLKPINLLLKQNPSEFWTHEKINRQKWHGIASIAGPSSIRAKSDPNKILLIIQIDADDPKPKAIIRRVIEKRGHLTDRKTIVQETPGGGLHVVFAIAVDPNRKEELKSWSYKSLRPRHCKPGCKIEIKTWFGGQITLEPSRYRKNRSKAYVNISGYKGLLEEDPIIYDLLISELKNADCLRLTPEEAHKLKQEGLDEDTKYGNGAAECSEKDRELNDPSDTRVKKAIDIILGKDLGNDGECHFSSIYVKGQRNETVIAILGHLFHNRIRLEFAKEIVRRLCHESNDEETEQRLNTANETYTKGYNNQKILGRSGLIDAFKRADRNGESEVRAKARLVELNKAFGFDKSRNSKNLTDPKLARLNEADLIANLARQKIRFMFINAVKQPCAIIKRDDVVELLVMSDKDGNFADTLRQIWRDENEASGNKLKTMLPEDRMTQARLSLISDAKRSRLDPIKTHLRVAWEKKNEIMRYDLADSLGRQIRIWGTDDGNGVEIINSDHVLIEIKEFENSKFSREKTPIFFQRFNQTAQVLPSDNFDPKILDVFINDLTNVVGRKASSSYKRSVQHWETEGSLDDDAKIHIAKVGLVSMLVPLIPHHLENVFGPPQAIKSTFLRQKKALIDPTTLDLFLPTKLKDIDKILAQNYFICFDNFYEISREFSDLICAAITGSGTQVRELFTTQTMVTLPIKACIAFSSVTRLFTQSDAVSRLLSYEFLPFAEEEGYSTEDEINDRFEEIRPQILACMYNTMSRAINIRNRIHGKYSLGRMADVLEWGEAISQALGYEPGLYLRRYDKLKKIQSRHSSSYDPLVYYYRKIYFDIFLKPESEFLYGRLNSDEEAIRKNGYTVFSSKELNQKLNEYAEEDEYDTKKSNKLWPQDSQQLADRTREVSITISKNDSFAVEVRKGKHNSNEYVLGVKEAVEKYIESQEADYKKQRAESKDELVEENSSNEINEMNVVQKTVQMNTFLNAAGEPPLSAPATFDVDDRSNTDNKSWKPETGTPSGGVQLLKVEHLNEPLKSEKRQEVSQNGYERSTFQQNVEQRRSTIQKLNTSGYSQRQIAKIIGISLGGVNRELKNLNGSSVQLSKKLNTCKLKVEHPIPTPKSKPLHFQDLTELVPELKNLASFDCEWYREDIPKNKESGVSGKLYCFCLVDTRGHEIKLHLEDFAGNEKWFIAAILDAIEPYDALVGYAILAKKKDYVKGSIDGDIEQLRKNCDRLEQVLKARFEAIEQRIKFLDLYSIFSCNSTKAFLTSAENVTYRGDTLHHVATAYLKEGKLKNLKGSDAEFLSPEEQAEYCLQDARLSLKLVEKDDYRLLKIFYNISKEIGQNFYSTCNYAKPTSWWRSKLKTLNYQEVGGETARWQADHIIKGDNGMPKKGVHYTGGKVFDPIVGLHKEVITYDVGSMYPTMCNVHNISSETINCDCCKKDLDAKIPNDIMELINSDLIKDGYEPRPWHYWICRKRSGILSSIMKNLIRKKNKYKREGQSLEEKAVKLFANSGYGAFGQIHFEYYDFRVAELITGFARYTLLELEQLLKDNGLQILYGDTDSLFVRKVGNIDGANVGDSNSSNYCGGAIDISTMAKERFNVDFSKDKTWKTLVLLYYKKQYFGILENDEISYKKLVGLKNNYPPYFNDVVLKLISKETIELFSPRNSEGNHQNKKDAKDHVSKYLRSAFNILGDNLLVGNMKFITQKLFYSAKTQKALYEHKRNSWQKYIFEEKTEDCGGDRALAEISSGAKSIHSFWKIVPNGGADNKKKNCTIHPERYTLDVDTYKKELWNCIEPIIQAYGFSGDECTALKNELINSQSEL
jgi:DNA polymerase elongation subunit (family B)